MKRLLIVLLAALFVLGALGCNKQGELSKVVVISPNVETKITYFEPQKGNVAYKRVAINIYGSKISTFALSYDNPRRVYVALASGEIYKTEDLCKTWEKIAKITLPSKEPLKYPNDPITIYSIAEGDNGRVLYVLANQGIFKSKDFGKAFTEIGDTLPNNFSAYSIIVSKNNPELIILINPPGSNFLSSDGGITFTPIAIGCSYIAYNHVTNEIIAISSQSLLRSKDFGKNWEKLAGDLNYINSLSISQTDQPVIIIATQDNSEKPKILITKDYGKNFSTLSLPYPISPYITINPKNPNSITFLSQDARTFLDAKMIFTKDGGSTFKELPIYDTISSAEFTLDVSRLFILSNHGVLYSWDSESTFELENVFPEVSFRGISVYGGNGIILTNGAAFQVDFSSGNVNAIDKDGFDPLFNAVISEKDPTVAYASSYARIFSLKGTNLKLIRYLGYVLQIIISPLDSNILFVEQGSEDGYFSYVSYDGGKTLQSLSYPQEPYEISSIALDPNNPSIIYAIGSENIPQPNFYLYKSEDNGKTFKKISESPDTGTYASINIFDSSIYIYSETSGLYKSDDYGKTFKAFNKGIGKIQNLVIKKLDFNLKTKDLFLLTDSNGLFMCKNGSDTWVDISGDFPKDKISALSVDKKTGKIYFGVDGVGLFEVIL